MGKPFSSEAVLDVVVLLAVPHPPFLALAQMPYRPAELPDFLIELVPSGCRCMRLLGSCFSFSEVVPGRAGVESVSMMLSLCASMLVVRALVGTLSSDTRTTVSYTHLTLPTIYSV